MRIRIFIFLVLLLIGCEKSQKDIYREVRDVGERRITINEIYLDTICIDGQETSCVGKWSCIDNQLIWGDFLFSSFYLYDTTFVFRERKLGLGRGPNEIPGRIADFEIYGNEIIAVGTSYDFYLINSYWGIVTKSRFYFDPQGIDMNEMANNPKPDHVGIYEINYPCIQIKPWSDYGFVLPIDCTHPRFNGYMNKTYYTEGRVLALLDTKNSGLDKIFGRHSPIYRNYRFIPQFSNSIYDVQDNHLLLSFEADSSIYVLSNPDSIMCKYGYNGRSMNQQYPEVHSPDHYVEIYQEHRPQYGYYKYLKYIPEKQLLFRGYQKGGPDTPDGLQIYSGKTLIGDVDVLRGFKVIGYISPYFYAEGVPDEYNQRLFLYRFKL